MENKNNTGIENSGDRNSGDRNSGDWNSGDWNSGDWNSGDWNSGDWNSGYRNSGDRNSGDWNSGYRNSGDRNSGDWNSGDWNSGYLNSNEPKVRIFNKETDLSRENITFPNFFCFNLNEWISESEMSDKEKEAYPSYVTTGGYLKVREYHQAWRESWDKADDEDRKKVLALPNWNNELFKEISGIDVEKELNSIETIEIGGIKYNKKEVEEKLKDIKAV